MIRPMTTYQSNHDPMEISAFSSHPTITWLLKYEYFQVGKIHYIITYNIFQATRQLHTYPENIHTSVGM